MFKNELLSLNIFEDNLYLDKYIELINNNLNTKADKFKTQKHHIIPRYYYNDLGIKINNNKANLVNLLYKDHILAHYYLSLCSIDKFKYNNEYAFIGMVNRDYLSVEDFNELTSLDNYQLLYEDACRRNSDSHIGKRHTKETCNKMSQSKKGHTTSIETREKIGTSNKGKYVGHIWIHRGTENKHISPDRFKEFEMLGFEKGRYDPCAFKKMKENNKMHQGMLGKHQSEFQKQRVKEFNTGRKMSEEARLHMSQSAKNRKR